MAKEQQHISETSNTLAIKEGVEGAKVLKMSFEGVASESRLPMVRCLLSNISENVWILLISSPPPSPS